jgi:hypothetical protein
MPQETKKSWAPKNFEKNKVVSKVMVHHPNSKDEYIIALRLSQRLNMAKFIG